MREVVWHCCVKHKSQRQILVLLLLILLLPLIIIIIIIMVQGLNPGGEIFHTHPKRPWGPPILYNRYQVLGKAAGVRHWPPIPSSAKVKERVELYLYSTSGPHGLFYGELYHLPLTAVVAANIHYKIIEITNFLLPLLYLESTWI